MASSFRPSTNGLKFTNSWPAEPDIIINVPGIGNVAIGNASNGLCGGMAYAVRDFFQFGLPVVTDVANPAQGTPLFNYIVGRLFDSFNIPDGVLQYYNWMITPDHDTGIWFAIRRGVSWMTIMDQLPGIKADIDGGQPSPLGLVTVATVDPTMIGHNHQVLAYGYEQDGGGNLTLHLYDPNTGAADDVFLTLNVNNPSHTTPIAHNVAIGLPIRGFFRTAFTAKDPSSLEPPPPPPPPPASLDVIVDPYPVPLSKPVTVTVTAQDSVTHADVTGTVLIDHRPAGTTGLPFPYTFVPRYVRGRRPPINGPVVSYPNGTISAHGYPLTPIDFGYPV